MKPLKILWAVDALEPLPEGMRKIAEVLRSFEKAIPLEVHPVYILSPEQIGLATEFPPPAQESYLETGARKALAQAIHEVKIPGLATPHILIHHQNSLRGSVRKLSEFAEKQGFEFIAVGSHGRRGFQKLMVGSFTEELLLQSRRPVLVVGPDVTIGRETENRFLVPNDLGDLDSPFFTEAFNFSKLLGAKVTLLHAIPRPVEAFLQSGVYLFSGAWVPIPIYLRGEKAKQEINAEQIRKWALKEGVPCETVVDYQATSVAESVLSQAKEMSSTLIVMEAQSGPVASALLGSVVRKVVRDAPCPVLVIRR